MGEKFLEDKAKRFKHKRDIAHERELLSPNLLSIIHDKSQKRFRFICPGTELKPSNSVMFVAEPDRQFVSVFHGSRRIGEVDPPGSSELRSIFSQHPALSNSIRARVCEGPDIAGFYEATLSLPR